MSDAAIERFFETYAERYMVSDIDAVAAMYEAPFLVVRESRPIHLPDREAVREHLAGLMEAYQNAGAKRATIADLEVTKLDSASVIATVRWNALSEDGALLRDFTVSYQMLRQESDGWRILSYTYHDERARPEEK
ncbi:MAG: nuclear transport factor 2 family protein [Actinobacteria bacterium]|nr:nuclear transport factor 2 family protein [Actinomycetota bacterium]